jgi:hypothetical protein
MKYIPKTKCRHRQLYRINSRNLTYGVYNKANGGFYGIRTKFDSRFIFPEYHWDNGPPYGTVKPIEPLEIVLPDDILLQERLPGYLCMYCNQPLKDEHNEIYKHDHIGDPCAAGNPVHGNTRLNKPLFDWFDLVKIC